MYHNTYALKLTLQKGTTFGNVLLSKKVKRTNMLQYKHKRKKTEMIHVCDMILCYTTKSLPENLSVRAVKYNKALGLAAF